jgi:hypothetical protein
LLSDPITVTIDTVILAPAPQTAATPRSSMSVDVREVSNDAAAKAVQELETATALRPAAEDEATEGAVGDIASDSLIGIAAYEELDRERDEDTGLWIEEGRDGGSGLFSIYAGNLDGSRRSSAMAFVGMGRDAHVGIDLKTMGAMLEQARLELELDQTQQQFVIGAVSVGATSMAAGYVFWALRGVQASAMLISATPTWASFDLLPVLAGTVLRKRSKEEGESLGEIAAEGIAPTEGGRA